MNLSPLALLFAVSAITFAPVAAGGGVEDGSCYSFNGEVVEFEVTQASNPGEVWVTATSAGGSGVATGIEGSGSTPQTPTCVSSGIITLRNGDEYRIGGGQPWKRNKAGKWVKGKKTKTPKPKSKNSAPRSGNIFGSSIVPADDVTGLPD
jgi:hypothetical protein